MVPAAGRAAALCRLKGLWTLYYLRHTGRWERYPLFGPSRRLDDLLSELAEDPDLPVLALTRDGPPERAARDPGTRAWRNDDSGVTTVTANVAATPSRILVNVRR
ncbi:MAG: DUF3024 domain-containing protein [Solirubrobacterales bacterium]|nr:DUF3024 domain-containing protein [Solirubrobacterales bacterium]MBV9810267.1 DUF3024 domain-containing protein [Solirubrobacterales bacterium]